jgi:hypothetical protein
MTPISPPRAAGPTPAERDPGSGRPTKQERRATDRLQEQGRNHDRDHDQDHD